MASGGATSSSLGTQTGTGAPLPPGVGFEYGAHFAEEGVEFVDEPFSWRGYFSAAEGERAAQELALREDAF